MPAADDRATRPGVLALARNPFAPDDVSAVAVAEPVSLADLAARHGMRPTDAPVIAHVDGRVVMQRDWAARIVGPGHHVRLTALPLGGGGSAGGGGKSILATVLQVAVLIAAAVIAPYAAAALGFTAGSFAFAAATTAVTAAITIGGTALINAVIPVQPPSLGNFGSGRASISASPTYTLAGRGNQARIDQPIPVVYGRHIVYPDYAASPYWEYVDNDQYLYQVLVIGQGSYEIERVAIGGAELASYAEIETEIVQPGQPVTLFAVDVYSAGEVTGQSMKAPNELAEGEDGIVGPFPACPTDQVTGEIGIDAIFPRGLYSADASGTLSAKTITWTVDARRIDSNGIPLDVDWTVIAEASKTQATATGQRVSTRYTMPSVARWDVRVRRTDDKDISIRAGHEIQWGGLRAYLGGDQTFGDVTVIAVKARATDNLNSQTSRQINATVTRKLSAWDAETSTWGPEVPTQSIAWAAADLLRNATYGAKLPTSRFDLDQLAALDAVWAARGDTFNGVFDQPSTVWEALGRILRTGRCKAYYQSGMVRFHRDAPQTLPVAMFTTANMVRDSMTLDFAMPVDGDSADGVEVEYFDARTWASASVIRGVGDVVPESPAREQVFGITDADQAAREASYQAAANRYRRAFASFRTELDGLIPSIGDPILVAHDVPRWGTSGVVQGWDALTRTLTIDGEIDVTPGTSYVARLRTSRGRASSPIAVVSASGRSIVLAADPGIAVVTGGAQEPTHYAIGAVGDEPRLAIVTSIAPRGETVEIRAVIEDARVHVN